MIYKFLNLFEIKLYYLQQKIYALFSADLNHLTLYTLILLFVGGVLTSLNPCLISTLPLATSQIYDNSKAQKNTVISGLISSVIFIIFVFFFFSKYSNQLTIHLPLVSSILTIIIGLNILKILKLDITTNNLNIQISRIENKKLIFNWITGFTIGLSSTSCSTPVLISTTYWLSHSKNSLLIILYLLIYLTGYTMPLYIFIYISFNYNKMTMFSKVWNYIIPAIGSLIVGIGFFSLLEYIFT
uniref:Cytochrome c biogenesis protein transmembrane region n=1 Tax=Caulacanthus okamurae TaxID=152008 RepID=A0A6H1U966_9FLOR|nr:cytochrome c biogenesis protein transmembrane region [Caulacanthus okamurae]QIZ74593.1 cytochrome c biogenesis protein transmembrane region [Caulacanthus okamurae]